MPRLKALANSDAKLSARGLLESVEKKLGKTPNIMRTMANSPAVLESYLEFSNALARGSLSAKLREQIALAVGEANNCQYCLAAHTALGRMAGLNDEQIMASRRGDSADRQTAVVLNFARKLVRERGLVTDDDVEKLREAGFNDGGIAEIVANVVVNIFTNYFNHVAQTDIDFPKAPASDGAPASACAA